MPKQSRLLVVLTDGEHARMVRPGQDNVLRTVQLFDSTSAHERSSDLGSDHPGASFHSKATVHHAIAPRHDLHMLEKEKFSRFVAQQLNEMADDRAFDTLVIVAPADSLNTLRDALNPATHEKIAGILHKDLVKVPDNALRPHLQAWLPPAHPVRKGG
ncbi:MAG: hypothetical protein B7X08_03230 [Acidocella sp. 20-63-7]|nr:MAG: hypothetical protein B7X08_03230 [Acidocella sp. 20-63-7]HQT47362.1 host attachment protein [Acidocella sp.]